jgi:hypothetical protein
VLKTDQQIPGDKDRAIRPNGEIRFATEQIQFFGL